MAKTPLFQALKKAFHLAQLTRHTNMPSADEIVEWVKYEKEKKDWSRRQFINTSLKTSFVFGAANLLPSCVLPPNSQKENNGSSTSAKTSSEPRIVIVGAGLAGLHAAYLLKKGGVSDSSLQIFEGSNRTGGRIFTSKLFGNSMTTEFGGEFIDSNHQDMLNLAKQFQITILDKKTDNNIVDAFFFNGKHYSFNDTVKAFRNCRTKVANDVNLFGENYDTPYLEKLDQITLKDYIDNLPTEPWFKELLEVAYIGEFGLVTEEQSAVNLIDLIGEQKKGFELFGESDERYKLLGGNQQICDRLAEELKDQIELGHMLVSVKNNGSGFILTFSKDNSTKEIKADIVIMTIPFSILKNVEGISNLDGITPKKLKCINELTYGSNGKIFIGLSDRPWRKKPNNFQGYLYTEDIHTGWDSYHLQNNNEGSSVYTIFLGGFQGAIVTPEKANNYLPTLEKAFPGFQTSHFSSQLAAMNWTSNPLCKGSYPCYKPGQWSNISGQEIEPIGNMFFAGDHCSSEFQGYINGAAETGRVTAEQILDKVKKNR